MKTILIILVLSVTSFANFVQLGKVYSQNIDMEYSRCTYQSYEYKVDIVIRGASYDCPYFIYYNPNNGLWHE